MVITHCRADYQLANRGGSASAVDTVDDLVDEMETTNSGEKAIPRGRAWSV